MSSPEIKNISLFRIAKSVAYACPFRPVKRDVSRDRHATSGRNAMDAASVRQFAAGRERKLRTAKSCGPGAATVASIRAGPCWCGNGDNKRRSPGRARRKPSIPRAGKAGPFWLNLWWLTGGLFLLPPRLRVQSAPGFPCALLAREGQQHRKAQAKSRRENEHVCFHVIASEAKQSRVAGGTLDYFRLRAGRFGGLQALRSLRSKWRRVVASLLAMTARQTHCRPGESRDPCAVAGIAGKCW